MRLKETDIKNIIFKSRELRRAYRFDEAHMLLKSQLSGQSQFSNLIWLHQPVFWQDISAGVCVLTRRNKEDADFIRQLWADRDFVYSFHRNAAAIPGSLEELAQRLDSEYTAIFNESNALHWVIRDRHYTPWGILSLTNISMLHRHAEVLIGVKQNAPFGLAAASGLILFQFYFKAISFNKLIALIYADNQHSLQFVTGMGFKQEGLLRRHLTDSITGKYIDLHQLGMLAEDAFTPTNTRLMKKLLS